MPKTIAAGKCNYSPRFSPPPTPLLFSPLFGEEVVQTNTYSIITLGTSCMITTVALQVPLQLPYLIAQFVSMVRGVQFGTFGRTVRPFLIYRTGNQISAIHQRCCRAAVQTVQRKKKIRRCCKIIFASTVSCLSELWNGSILQWIRLAQRGALNLVLASMARSSDTWRQRLSVPPPTTPWQRASWSTSPRFTVSPSSTAWSGRMTLCPSFDSGRFARVICDPQGRACRLGSLCRGMRIFGEESLPKKVGPVGSLRRHRWLGRDGCPPKEPSVINPGRPFCATPPGWTSLRAQWDTLVWA